METEKLSPANEPALPRSAVGGEGPHPKFKRHDFKLWRVTVHLQRITGVIMLIWGTCMSIIG